MQTEKHEVEQPGGRLVIKTTTTEVDVSIKREPAANNNNVGV